MAVGGAAGVGAREALVLAMPESDGIPVTILVINVVGALLLGVLAEALVRSSEDPAHHDAGRRRSLRLLLGTGVLGGFTTFSALAVDGAILLAADPISGVGYTIGTVVIGAVATFAGMLIGAAIGHRRREAAP